jgi:hypothetical protein
VGVSPRWAWSLPPRRRHRPAHEPSARRSACSTNRGDRNGTPLRRISASDPAVPPDRLGKPELGGETCSNCLFGSSNGQRPVERRRLVPLFRCRMERDHDAFDSAKWYEDSGDIPPASPLRESTSHVADREYLRPAGMQDHRRSGGPGDHLRGAGMTSELALGQRRPTDSGRVSRCRSGSLRSPSNNSKRFLPRSLARYMAASASWRTSSAVADRSPPPRRPRVA